MKTTIKTVLLLCAMIATAGCKDFLTEKPKTSLFSQQIFSSDDMAYVGLVGCYRKMSHDNYHNFPYQEVIFPDAVFITTGLDVLSSPGTTYQPVIDLACYRQVPTNGSVTNLFSGIYHEIFTCNDFIANVEGSPLSDMAKSRYEGEARFLRAVAYFDLVRIWGKGQLWTGRTENYQAANRKFSSADKIFAQIIDDFKFAYDNMPTKDGGDGRVKQIKGFPFNMAAYAYLAKVYAAMATSDYMFMDASGNVNTPYTAADKANFWEQSYQYAKTVYDSHQYRLLDDYAQLWQCRTNSSDESIHEINFNYSAGSYWNSRCLPQGSYYTPLTSTVGGINYKFYRPTVVLYRWNVQKYGVDAQFASNTPNKERDPRIGENYIIDRHTRIGGNADIIIYPSLTPPTGTNVNMGISAYVSERTPVSPKYCDPLWVTNNQSRMSFIRYRYADLLLVLAEAANETGRPVDEVIGYVNQILDRARQSTVNFPSADPSVWIRNYFPDQVQPVAWNAADYQDRDKLRLEIMKERLFEMPMEGSEWYDVRRRGSEWFKMITTMFNNSSRQYAFNKIDYVCLVPGDTLYDRRAIVPNGMDGGIDQSRKQLLMPVPQDELNNNTALTPDDQNYGY